MRTFLACMLLAAVAQQAAADPADTIAMLPDEEQLANADAFRNPAIDMAGYLAVAQEAAQHRVTRRLGVAEFLRMSREPGTIVLDARSAQKYALSHVKGAVNLSFPDIDVASLARVLPDRDARILIYCNNNFRNDEAAFPRKTARASLNLSSYIALYSYGYRNIYELGPLLDAKDSGLELVGAPRVTGR